MTFFGWGELMGARIPVQVADGRRRHAKDLRWKATAASTSVEKLVGLDAEPVGEQFQGGEADVAFASLDGADVGSV